MTHRLPSFFLSNSRLLICNRLHRQADPELPIRHDFENLTKEPAAHLVGLDFLQQRLHVLDVLGAALQAVQLANRQSSLQTRQMHTHVFPSRVMFLGF